MRFLTETKGRYKLVALERGKDLLKRTKFERINRKLCSQMLIINLPLDFVNTNSRTTAVLKRVIGGWLACGNY